MKYSAAILFAICLVLFQTGCAGYYSTGPGPGPGYYGPTYPVAGWGGAGFYGGACYNPTYVHTGSWNGSSGNVNGWRGGSASWDDGSGHATGWRGGSASWGGGSGSWHSARGGSGSWHR